MCDDKVYGIETYQINHYPDDVVSRQLVSVEWLHSEDDRDQKLMYLDEVATGYSEYEDEPKYNENYYDYVAVECAPGEEYTIEDTY